MTRDAKEFGAIVDALVGRRFERSLAVNSIKLRFGTEAGPKGTHYIWIDPPWELHTADELMTTSADYDDDTFEEWSRLLDPLNRDTLDSWRIHADGRIEFSLGCGYRILVPFRGDSREDDSWYSHWYASDRTT